MNKVVLRWSFFLMTMGCGFAATTASAREGSSDRTAIGWGRCLFAPPVTAPSVGAAEFPGAAIAGMLVERGINHLGGVLTAAGASKVSKDIGYRNIELLQNSSFVGTCIQVVRAPLSESGAKKEPPAALETIVAQVNARRPKQNTAANGTKTETEDAMLATNGVGLAGAPSFFAEFQIVRVSADNTAAVVQPIVAFLQHPLEPTFLRKDERAVSVVVTFGLPGKAIEDAGNPSTILNLGTLKPGKVVLYPGAYDPQTGNPSEGPWMALPEKPALGPRILAVSTLETRDRSAMLEFLGAVLSSDAVAKEAGKQVTASLTPTTPAEAVSAIDAFDKAVADARRSLELCASVAGDAEVWPNAAAALASMRAANLAAKRAGATEPFGPSVMGTLSASLRGNSAANLREACGDVQ